jgi:hypothetical protein
MTGFERFSVRWSKSVADMAANVTDNLEANMAVRRSRVGRDRAAVAFLRETDRWTTTRRTCVSKTATHCVREPGGLPLIWFCRPRDDVKGRVIRAFPMVGEAVATVWS